MSKVKILLTRHLQPLLKGRSKFNTKCFLLIIIFIFFGSIAYPNDSLIYTINNSEASIKKVDALSEFAWQKYDEDDFNLSKKYGKEALKESKALDYLRGKCDAFQILGACYSRLGVPDSAFLFYREALKNRMEYGDSVLISATINNIGNVHKEQGEYLLAIERYEAAELYLPEREIQRKGRLQTNLGSVYKELGEYSKSLNYHNQASKIFENLGNKVEYAYSQMNIGNVYDAMADYDKALELYNEAEKIFINFDKDLGLGKTRNNRGNIFYKNGRYIEALNDYESALMSFQKSNSPPDIAGTEQNIALVHKVMGNYTEAQAYLKGSLKRWEGLKNKAKQGEVLINLGNFYLQTQMLAESRQSFLRADTLLASNSILRAELYWGMSIALAGLNLHEDAFTYQTKFNYLRDAQEKEKVSWRNLESRQREAENKIALLEKDQQIALEKSEKEKNFRLVLLLSLLLLLLLLIGSYLVWKGKQKRLIAEKKAVEKQQQVESLLKNQELKSIRNVLDVQDKERKRIAQDLHDRLGSMLAMVQLHFQKIVKNTRWIGLKVEPDYLEATQILDKSCDEVREISHNLISGVLKNFGLIAALEELKSMLIGTGQYQVELITHQLKDRLSSDYEIAIYRIIQELTSNIMRHAEADEISIQLLRNNGNLHINVEDNGKGFNQNANSGGTGIGLKNVKSRLHQFGGKITIDSILGRGASVLIDVPLNKKL